jgi:hypothetical protein
MMILFLFHVWIYSSLQKPRSNTSELLQKSKCLVLGKIRFNFRDMERKLLSFSNSERIRGLANRILYAREYKYYYFTIIGVSLFTLILVRLL